MVALWGAAAWIATGCWAGSPLAKLSPGCLWAAKWMEGGGCHWVAAGWIAAGCWV